jgi:hypothetical protein
MSFNLISMRHRTIGYHAFAGQTPVIFDIRNLRSVQPSDLVKSLSVCVRINCCVVNPANEAVDAIDTPELTPIIPMVLLAYYCTEPTFSPNA